jgi:hypothetical protein
MTGPRKPRPTQKPANKRASAAKGKPKVYNDAVKAAARALWEGDPRITKHQVAEEMDIPYGTIDRWSKGDAAKNGERRAESWVKNPANLSGRAKEIADKFEGKLADLGPEITAEQKAVAETETSTEVATELRAKVLDRHRKEWNAPRTISYEAIKERSFDKAKLAKITSETLKLIQDGERKAWGIDAGGDNTNVTVVIERI